MDTTESVSPTSTTTPPLRSPTSPGGWLAAAPKFELLDTDGYSLGPLGPGGLSLLEVEQSHEVAQLCKKAHTLMMLITHQLNTKIDTRHLKD